MKTITLTTLFVALLFAGCSKDEDNGLKLKDSSFSLTHEEEAIITPQNYDTANLTFKSSDVDVATVSTSGIIIANLVGDAVITVSTKDGKQTQECSVTVLPTIQTYVEPCVKFGCSIADVKAFEKRTLDIESSTILKYNDTNSNVRFIGYLFDDNGKLKSSLVYLTTTTTVIQSASTFLKERYNYLGYSSNAYAFNRGKISIVYTLSDTYGLVVAYVVNSGTSSIAPSMAPMLNEFSRVK